MIATLAHNGFGQEFYQRLPKSPYKPLEYPQLNVKWYTTFFESKHVTDSTDGYNGIRVLDQVYDWERHDNTLITDNAIYQAYYYEPSFSKGVYGSFIDKLDRSTGKVLWRKYFGLPQNNASIVQKLSINENGDVEVAFLELINGQMSLIIYNAKNIFSLRILNDSDGQEILYQKASETEGVQIPYSIVQQSEDLFRESAGVYRYFPFFLKDPGNGFNLNNLSTTVSTSSTNNNIKFDTLISKFGVFHFEIKQLDNGNYLITDRDTLNRFLFHEVSPDLKIIKSTYSQTNPSEFYSIHSLDFDPKSNQFLFTNRTNPEFPNFFSTYELYKLGIDGVYSPKYVIPQIYETRFGIIEWKKSDTIYLVATNVGYTSSDKPYFILDVLECTPGDTCKVHKSFFPTDSLRFVGTFTVFDLDDNIYLKWVEAAYFKDTTTLRYKFDRFAYALSSLMISKSELIDKRVGVNDLSRLSDFYIYPNPSTDGELTIILEKPVSGNLVIYDTMGRIMDKYKISSTITRHTLGTSSLGSGMYCISIVNEQGIHISKSKKWVKI